MAAWRCEDCVDVEPQLKPGTGGNCEPDFPVVSNTVGILAVVLSWRRAVCGEFPVVSIWPTLVRISEAGSLRGDFSLLSFVPHQDTYLATSSEQKLDEHSSMTPLFSGDFTDPIMVFPTPYLFHRSHRSMLTL